MSFRRQASSAKLMSLGGKLTVLACHPTKRVNKAEELNYLSTNIHWGKPSPMFTVICKAYTSGAINSALYVSEASLFKCLTRL